ncbi:MAG: class I SAM-dependent methyltransferase [Balneolaceae bacterium]
MLHTIRRDLSNLEIKYVDNNYIFIPPILFAVVEIMIFFMWGFDTTLLVALPLILFLILSFLFHLYRKLAKDLEEERRQNQALMSLHHFLNLRYPLPSMSHWAAFPELGITIIEYCRLIKPKFILEAGSGVSSIISCYCLEENGGGKFLSLDHDKDYSQQTNEQIKNHKLSSIGSVVHSPLETYEIDSKLWKWYNLSGYTGENKIDLLIIDGPPEKTQTHARYPALPLLHKHLSKEAVIILDDAGRKSESEIIQKWLKLYPEFNLIYKPSKKGIAVLKRNA